MRRNALVLAGVAVALAPIAMTAQQPLGTIRGTITDPDGFTVEAADVRVVSQSTGYGWSAQTDVTGFFLLALPPADEYVLTAKKAGFREYRQTAIAMTTHGQVRLEIGLVVGSLFEEVVVTDRPPLLTTDDGRLKGEIISREEIATLPLVRRSYETLALLMPGVVPGPRGASGGSFMSANGARADQTNFYIDGIGNRDVATGDALVRPNVDSVREYRVDTSGYSAKYGRNAGASVHVALRSGTNSLHGDFFSDTRNDLFDATAYFLNRRGADKRDTKYNRFGAALGGPLVVPKVYDGRNRSFFHFSYEGVRASVDRRTTGNVPTALERQGDFSQTGAGRLRDPQAGGSCNSNDQSGCFPNGIIPTTRLDPIGVGVANLYSLPNFTPTRFESFSNLLRDTDSFAVKIDHQIQESDRLAFRFQNTKALWTFRLPQGVTQIGDGQRTMTEPCLSACPIHVSFLLR